MNTGMKPLAMSPISTSEPARMPSTRKTLVVPTLPEPWSRTSTCQNHLPITIAKGTEPMM